MYDSHIDRFQCGEPEEGLYMHAGSSQQSQQMKIYIRGGEAFRVTAWRSGAATDADAEFWLTGYPGAHEVSHQAAE